MISYIINNLDRIFFLMLDHMVLSLSAFVLALTIAIVFSMIALKYKFLKAIILKSFGLIYTVPSMALFALLIPILGLGKSTAIFTLVCYSQFILIKNIVVSLDNVPEDLILAGLTLGFNELQILFKVKIPFSLPILMSGFRLTIISLISLSTLAAWINAGGLGVLIFEGLYTNHMHKLIVGTFSVALLSLICNWVLLKLEQYLIKT